MKRVVSSQNEGRLEDDENFRFLFGAYAMIGVIFRNKTDTPSRSCSRLFLAIFFHLFSAYFLSVLLYAFINKFGGEGLTAICQFVLTNLIRLYFVFNAAKIVELQRCIVSCRSLLITTPPPRKSLKVLISSYMAFQMILAIAISNESLFPRDIEKAVEESSHHLFDFPFPNRYFLVLTGAIEFIRNYIEIFTPGLTFMMLCLFYKELDSLLIDTKENILVSVSKYPIDSDKISESSDILCKMANIVSKVDSRISKPLFYLLILYILQVMAFITVFADRYPGFIQTIAFTLISVNVIFGICAVGVLTSRIPERYSEIKTLIISSKIVRNEIAQGQSSAVALAGFGQLLHELTNSFHATAIGAFWMDKSVVITILCSFITYGVLIFQTFQKK